MPSVLPTPTAASEPPSRSSGSPAGPRTKASKSHSRRARRGSGWRIRWERRKFPRAKRPGGTEIAMRFLQHRRDLVVERGLETRAEAKDRRGDGGADAAGDQRVFDRRRAALADEKLAHEVDGRPQLGFV